MQGEEQISLQTNKHTRSKGLKLESTYMKRILRSVPAYKVQMIKRQLNRNLQNATDKCIQ